MRLPPYLPWWRPLRPAGLAACLILALPGPASPRGRSLQEGPTPADTLRATIERSASVGDSAALAAAHNALGLLHWDGARFDSALVHLNRARALWTSLADSAALGRVYNNLGATQYQWGNLQPALEAYLQALSLRRAVGDTRGVALVLTNIGRVYGDWTLSDRALGALDEAVVVADEAGDAFVRGYARHVRAMVRLSAGDVAGARGDLEASLGIYQDPASGLDSAAVRSGWGLNTRGLALVRIEEGDPGGAVALLEQLFDGAPENARGGRQVAGLLDLATAYRASGAGARAAATLERALALSRASGQRTQRLQALRALSEVERERGRLETALGYYAAHRALRDSVQTQSGEQQVSAIEFRSVALRQAEENRRLREAQREQELLLARQRAVVLLGSALLLVSVLLVATLVAFNRIGRGRETQLEEANRGLREALSEVRTLKGLIPICARCKKVRDDQGFWESVEKYVSSRSDAMFSHGICNECGPVLYGDQWPEVMAAAVEAAAEGGVVPVPPGDGSADPQGG